MNGLKVAQLIIVDIHSNSEEQPSVASIYNFIVVIFNEIGVFLVT